MNKIYIRNQLLRKLRFKQVKKNCSTIYNGFIRKLNLQLTREIPGEKEWLDKWTLLGYEPDPQNYRLYSQYVGNDIRIVPEDICRTVVENCLNPHRFLDFYADKNSWGLIFPENIFPPTLIRCMDGTFFDASYNPLHGENIVENILLAQDEVRHIIKPTRDSDSARGFNTLLRDGQHIVLKSSGKRISDKDLIDLVGNNFIVQPFMKQHAELSKLSSTSVNPIRITTYRSVKDEQIHVLNGGVLKIGALGEDNDSTHGNGRFVGIKSNGELKSSVLNYWGESTHVFNSVDFEKNKFVIPGFEEAKKLAVEVASKVRHARLLAFDIMIDENGKPVVLEFNLDSFSVWYSQFSGEPSFGDFTDEIIEFSKKSYDATKMIFKY